MKRRQLVELEDLAWWPRLFRNYATDYLATTMRYSKPFDVIAPRLASAMKQVGTTEIVDLCAGGGGPWSTLLSALRAQDVQATVLLTDKYPNLQGFAATTANIEGVYRETESIDAEHVPAKYSGLRTVFNAFHHFPPAQAKRILANAVQERRGIVVCEALARTPVCLAAFVLIPLIVWLITPAIRPFRLSRLFWTYLIPIVPLTVLFDGIVSCLRIYSEDELRAMVAGIDDGSFDWEIGSVLPKGAPVPVTYLIGLPRSSEATRPCA